MTYAEEMRRIRHNKVTNKDCYTSLKNETTIEKLETLRSNLATMREQHDELIRYNFDKLTDPGSDLEMWLYIMADIKEIIRRISI